MTRITHLPDRGVIEIAGPDRVVFLQGLVSNDVAAVTTEQAVWAALLTPQGKYLADFFILAAGERLLLDCERAQAADLARRLSRFRLRAQVTAQDLSADLHVHVAWDGPSPPASASVIAQSPDPRLQAAGTRILSTALLATNADSSEWDQHRLRLGLPDGSRDLESEKSVLLEAGFDELSGVSWTKGCYMGQELTARTKYRGLIKRRLFPVTITGPAPPPGTVIMQAGRDVGTMRSSRGSMGLALLRIDSLKGDFACGETSLKPARPAWMKLPGAEDVSPRL